MKVRLLVLGLSLIFSVQAFAQGDAKAQEIIKKARAAIGKEDKLKSLQNIVAEGTFKQSAGQRNLEGPLEVTIAMPDKIHRSITRSFGPMEMVQIDVLNGAQTWNDMVSSQPMPGGPGGGGFRMMGGGPGGGGGFLSPEVQERNRRFDLARVMLGWLLVAPAGLNAEYTYIGEAKAPDGTADVIGVKTADGLVARLYIDQQSKQLLMLSYKDKDMRSMFQQGGRGTGAGPGGQGGQGRQGGQAGPGGQRGPGGMSREEFEKLPQAEKDKIMAEQRARQEARMAEMKAAYEKAPEVDIQWSFAEYKEFGGLNLPTVLTKATGGTPNEEWVISKFKINEKKVSADKFEKKSK